MQNLVMFLQKLYPFKTVQIVESLFLLQFISSSKLGNQCNSKIQLVFSVRDIGSSFLVYSKNKDTRKLFPTTSIPS